MNACRNTTTRPEIARRVQKYHRLQWPHSEEIAPYFCSGRLFLGRFVPRDGDNDNNNSNINNSSAGDNNNTLAFVGLETRAVLCPRLASLPLDQSESEGWHLFAPPRKASLVLLRERDRFTEVIAYCTLQGAS